MYLPDVPEIFLGVTGVTALYLGEDLVWPVTGSSEEYFDCTCIYGNGNSDGYISFGTGLISTTTKFRFKGEFIKKVGNTHLGAVNSLDGLSDSNDYRLFYASLSSVGVAFDMGNKRLSCGNIVNLDTPVDLTCGNFYVYNNDTQAFVKTGTTITTVPTNASFRANIGRLKINSLQIWETSGGTDELIFDGVPKIRVSDEQPGIYDEVSGTFFTDTGITLNVCNEIPPTPPEPPTPPVYEEEYLTLSISSGGTLNLGRITNYNYSGYYRGGFVGDYSINGGPWITSVPVGGNYPTSETPQTITVNAGDKIRFRGDYTGWDYDSYGGAYPYTPSFSESTCEFSAYGNINSIIFGDAFSAHTGETVAYAYAHLFEHTKITTAEHLITPTGNYENMVFFETFYGCSLLLDSPEFRCSTYTYVRNSSPFTEAFCDCTSLKSIRMPYLEKVVQNTGFPRWVRNVPYGGTFVKKAGVQYPYGYYNNLTPNGIPSGWYVVEV